MTALASNVRDVDKQHVDTNNMFSGREEREHFCPHLAVQFHLTTRTRHPANVRHNNFEPLHLYGNAHVLTILPRLAAAFL